MTQPTPPEPVSNPRDLLEAIGELALAIAPHHMEVSQRRKIAAAMGVLVDHVIALARSTKP